MRDIQEWLYEGATVSVIDTTVATGRRVSSWIVKRITPKTVLLWRHAYGRDQELRVSLNTLEKRQAGSWGGTQRVVPTFDPEAVKLRVHQRRMATASKVIDLMRPLASQMRYAMIADDEWAEAASEAAQLLSETLPLEAPRDRP